MGAVPDDEPLRPVEVRGAESESERLRRLEQSAATREIRLSRLEQEVQDLERLVTLLQNAELERNTREKIERAAISRREAIIGAVAVAVVSPVLTALLSHLLRFH